MADDFQSPHSNSNSNSNGTPNYEPVLHANAHNSFDRVHKSNSIPNENNSSGLNPRSCVTCRRRKVKCDKKHPCTNCSKARIDCIFPAPGRAPRKPRKPQDGELMERLRKLEGVVQSLGVDVGDEDESADEASGNGNGNDNRGNDEDILRKKMAEVKELKMKRFARLDADKSSTGLESQFGRLVVDEGRSRYINPSFWASLSDEVEDIKGILNEESEDEYGNYPSPESSDNVTNTQGYIFGHNSKSVDMLALHPPPDHVPKYWTFFKDRVDPLVKVLHIPTIEPTVLEARHRLDQIHRGLETLMFAVYYGAVTSLPNEEIKKEFGEEKLDLIMRYKFGVEQALARADFLQTDEIIVLQAYVIFLICLRRNDDARIIWTLTGLVVRMAQTLGLHRDGGHYDLSPFDVEMRRRLWWQICILDSRASEDHGCDPTITEQSFDTQMPLNVNDEDISPPMATFPESRLGCTEMTFGLIRFEIVAILRRIQYVPPGPKQCNQFFATVSLEQKEQWITESHAKIEERYLKHCDMSVPLYWVIATVARLIMSKMWLMIYHPFQRQDGGNSLPQETKDKLFLTSLENIEYSLLLENEIRTKKWGWLFQTYVQWHAIAFLLNELCIRTKGEYVERAWHAVEIVTSRRWGAEYANNKLKSHLWRPLRRLMNKARAAREAELGKEKLAGVQRTNSELRQAPGMDINFTAPWGVGMDVMDVPSNLPSPGPGAGLDYMNLPTGLTPLPTGFTPGPESTTFQPFADSTNDSLNGDLLPQGRDISPANITSPPRNDYKPQTNNFPVGMPSAAPRSTQQDIGLDWFFTDPAAQQISPSGTGSDELMLDGNIDWANWDEMVAQFGAQEGVLDASGVSEVTNAGGGDGLLSAGMPGPGGTPGNTANIGGGFGIGGWY